MLAGLAAAVTLPPGSLTPTAKHVPAPIAAPSPATKTSPASAAERRFVILVGQGLQAAQEGSLSEAVRLLRRALELKPTDAESWNSLGVVLVRQGEMAAGIDAFRQALHLDPNQSEPHRNLAVALDREGRSAEAVTHYQAFLRLSPESHPARVAVRGRLAAISDPRSAE